MRYHLLILPVLLLTSSLSHAALQSGTVFAEAMNFAPDIQQGKTTYLAQCSQCHGEKGWGTYDGEYPQLAGQHTTVIIKQLQDIHTGKRANPIMSPAVAMIVDSGPATISNVAGYLSSLLMNPYPEWGEADDPSEAAAVYQGRCASCHGPGGEGNADSFYPLLHGQHYEYLLRELRWLRDGSRGKITSATTTSVMVAIHS